MYENKDQNYYFNSYRFDLLELIPTQNRNGNLLEVGAASGNTLMYAKQNHYASTVYGIDICSIENSYQKSPEITQFTIGNIEQKDVFFTEDFFDVIICGDVLEHLIDPWNTINKLKAYLSVNGIIIASIPNIREFKTMKKILFSGNFEYEESGVLDKTHLRFFCKKNIEKLFTDNGMQIQKMTNNISHSTPKRNLFNKLSFGMFEEFLVTQYIVVATKQKEYSSC
jgi:2-polyprenyl-3-methyl-5-hydroxy-6-metoxy-1,4-benzoquinol methylase